MDSLLHLGGEKNSNITDIMDGIWAIINSPNGDAVKEAALRAFSQAVSSNYSVSNSQFDGSKKVVLNIPNDYGVDRADYPPKMRA